MFEISLRLLVAAKNEGLESGDNCDASRDAVCQEAPATSIRGAILPWQEYVGMNGAGTSGREFGRARQVRQEEGGRGREDKCRNTSNMCAKVVGRWVQKRSERAT